MNNLLIACCPRTGTVYTTKLFEYLGVPAGHEFMRPDLHGMEARYYFHKIVEVSYGAVTNLERVKKPYKMAIQYKHPLLVVRRFAHVATVHKKGIEEYTDLVSPGLLKGRNIIDKACMMYYNWYRIAEEFMAQMPPEDTHRFKIEDINTEIFRLLELVGVERDREATMKVIEGIPTNTNTKKGMYQDAFADLKFEDLTDYMQDYILELGYPKDPTEMPVYQEKA